MSNSALADPCLAVVDLALAPKFPLDAAAAVENLAAAEEVSVFPAEELAPELALGCANSPTSLASVVDAGPEARVR